MHRLKALKLITVIFQNDMACNLLHVMKFVGRAPVSVVSQF